MGAHEMLVRLIWFTKIKDGKVVSKDAFKPNKHDEDGVSLYRSGYLTNELECLNTIEDPRKQDFYALARWPAQDFLDLDLKLMPTKGNLPGHVSITSLTPQTWEKGEGNLLARVDKLVASKNMVVIRDAVRRDYSPAEFK